MSATDEAFGGHTAIALGIEDGLREAGAGLHGCTPSMLVLSIQKRIAAERSLLWQASRKVEGDPREFAHIACDCVPDLGPEHCHLCGEREGRVVPWSECVSRKVEVSADKAIAAIATIEFSRQTHVEWRDWLRAHPEDKRGEVTGDADYQQRTITQYDNVLAVLRTPQPAQVEVTDGILSMILLLSDDAEQAYCTDSDTERLRKITLLIADQCGLIETDDEADEVRALRESLMGDIRAERALHEYRPAALSAALGGGEQ